MHTPRMWGWWQRSRSRGCGILVVAILAGCSGSKSSAPLTGPTPKPVTRLVDFGGETFRPEPLPSQGILSAERAYKIWTGDDHWHDGVIVQYGKLTNPPARPGETRPRHIAVWAFEAIGLCQAHGGLGFTATPAHKYCRAWDFVDAATGEPILGIGL